MRNERYPDPNVLEIIIMFSAKLYRSRREKNKKIVEALHNAAKEL